MTTEQINHCDTCGADFYYPPAVHRCPGEWEAVCAEAGVAPLAAPAAPAEDAELAASRARVDAAVLAHREDPTEANHAALMAAQAAHHELFLAHQTIEFQDRTHVGGRYSDWTRDNVVIHDPGRPG